MTIRFTLKKLIIFALAAMFGIILVATLVPKAKAAEPKIVTVTTDEGKELILHRDAEQKNGGYVTIIDHHSSDNVESAIVMMDGTAIVELRDGSTVTGKVLQAK